MRLSVLCCAIFGSAIVHAQPIDRAALEACAEIEDAAVRLACFDRLVPQASPRGAASRAVDAVLAPESGREGESLLAERWAIGQSSRDRRFDLREHKASYFLLGRYSDAPNRSPASPTKPAPAEPLDLQPVEAKFQISFKVKLADFDRLFQEIGAHLWLAYTQQSQWQVYNPRISRPFRETNYEPEVIIAAHPDLHVLGWRWRLAALGFSHHSNGRDNPFSRSWNRLYVMGGFEQGNYGLLARLWVRVPEDGTKDDNPDISRYMGYGDVLGAYRYGGHTLSLVARYNPASAKGALQAAWNFPLQRRVRGYVQAFSGYGESLIDYNVRQNTIGLGISLADAM